MRLDEKDFKTYLAEAIDSIPKPYSDRLQNVAFILEDEPTAEQRRKLRLNPHQTLFGLYEGVPLPGRQGVTKLLPDKITIFRNPLLVASRDEQQLRDNIGHTVWHEVAHYFGLDHERIDKLDAQRRGPSKA